MCAHEGWWELGDPSGPRVSHLQNVGVGPYDLRSLSGQGSMVLSPKYVCAMIYWL